MMRWNWLVLCALAVGLLGCGKQTEHKLGGTDPVVNSPSIDPNGSYTIQLRNLQVGEKYQIETNHTESRQSGTPKRGYSKAKEFMAKTTSMEEILSVEKEGGKYERTVVTYQRTFSKAEITEDGNTRTPDFVGKTITFSEGVHNVGSEFQTLLGTRGCGVEQILRMLLNKPI